MSVFLLFTLVGLLVFAVAAGTRPRKSEQPVPPVTPLEQGVFSEIHGIGEEQPAGRFGRMRDSCRLLLEKLPPKDPLARWAIGVITTAAVTMGALAFVLWPWLRLGMRPYGPFSDFVNSPLAGSATLGFFFGVLLGYWLASVYGREGSEPPSYKEIVTGVLMLLLLVIGLLGQDELGGLLSRLTGLELAGAKLAFSERRVPADPAALVNGARTIATSAPPNRSSAIFNLSNLDEQIVRDSGYADLVGSSSVSIDARRMINRDLEAARAPDAYAFAEFAACLKKRIADQQDEDGVTRVLDLVTEPLDLYLNPSDPVPVQQSFVQGSHFKKFVSTTTNPSRHCLDALHRLQRGREQVISVAPDSRRFPYLWIAYADLLAYGHNPIQAIAVLNDWLRRYGYEHWMSQHSWNMMSTRDQASWAEEIVFRIRVRIQMFIILDEWIKASYNTFNSATLSYELVTIERLLKDMQDPAVAVLVAEPLAGLTSHRYSADRPLTERPDGEACSAAFMKGAANGSVRSRAEAFAGWELKLVEARTATSFKTTWIELALKSPDFVEFYSAKAMTFARELLETDFSCFPFRTIREGDAGVASSKEIEDDVNVQRAETLLAFAQVQAATFLDDPKVRKVVGQSALQAQLGQAVAAVRIGSNILAGIKSEQIKDDPCGCETGPELNDALSPTPRDHYAAELRATALRLEQLKSPD